MLLLFRTRSKQVLFFPPTHPLTYRLKQLHFGRSWATCYIFLSIYLNATIQSLSTKQKRLYLSSLVDHIFQVHLYRGDYTDEPTPFMNMSDSNTTKHVHNQTSYYLHEQTKESPSCGRKLGTRSSSLSGPLRGNKATLPPRRFSSPDVEAFSSNIALS
jgi:hypothetical protein